MTKHHQQRGITFIEITVVMVILTMAIGLFASFQQDIKVQRRYSERILRSLDESRRVMQFIASELRSAQQAADGTYAIFEATDTTLGFYADLDNDNLTEKIYYYLVYVEQTNGEAYYNMYREVTTPSGQVQGGYQYPEASTETYEDYIRYINNGSTPIFEYYDDTYTGTEDSLGSSPVLADIRLVKIQLNVQPTPDFVKPLEVVTQVTLRNLKDNY